MGIRNLSLPSSLVNSRILNTPSIEDITDQLPHNKNYTWAQLAGVRDINDLTDIVVHHSGVRKSLGCTAERHATNHINGRAYEPKGEPGIPYHVYINGGQAYQVNDLLDRTYGVASNNAYTVHICVEGDYKNYDTLTDSDRAALYGAILAVKAVLPAFNNLKGHNEYNPTDCPGFDMNQVRADIAKIELQIKATMDPSTTMSNIYNAANQHMYLYQQYSKDPNANKWLEPYLLKMHEITKEMGMYFND